MPHGKTLEMIALSRQRKAEEGRRRLAWVEFDRPARVRDRSLRGKARVRARKAARRT
jgi:hypothetical protein